MIAHATTWLGISDSQVLVLKADIDALALQHLQLGTDSVIAVGGLTSQLVCRFQGTGTGADTAIIVVASGYSDAATASSEDGLARTTAQEQGGVFIKLDGVAEEAYSFTYPTLTGVAARNGNRSVSIGVGKLLGVPNPGDYKRSFVGPTPVVVSRNTDGTVHVFENRCAHRGVEFCRQHLGNTKEFVCPYHSWTYDLVGNLHEWGSDPPDVNGHGRFRGGFYGDAPSLTNLSEGNVIYTTDFRSLYATVLDQVIGVTPSTFLDGKFPQMSFI